MTKLLRTVNWKYFGRRDRGLLKGLNSVHAWRTRGNKPPSVHSSVQGFELGTCQVSVTNRCDVLLELTNLQLLLPASQPFWRQKCLNHINEMSSVSFEPVGIRSSECCWTCRATRHQHISSASSTVETTGYKVIKSCSYCAQSTVRTQQHAVRYIMVHSSSISTHKGKNKLYSTVQIKVRENSPKNRPSRLRGKVDV